jgi:hypothetical protein
VCPDVERELFAVRCAGSQCHAGPRAAAGLDLTAEGVAGRLVDRPGRCGGLLVDPADPLRSLLWIKTGEAPPDDCPTTMPLTGDPLDPLERECLLAWIEEAAASK